MTDRKPAVAIISTPGAKQAFPPRNGPFKSIHLLDLPVQNDDSAASRLQVVKLARQTGAEWMIVLRPGQTLREDAFELVAPALDLFDAVFGSAVVAGSGEVVAKLSRLAFDVPERLPHALLNWWLPDVHLVRTDVALRLLGRETTTRAKQWKLDYLFDIWNSARCLKSAQPMLQLESEPKPLDAEDREYVLDRLAEQPVFLPIVHGDATFHLPYTGRNAGIEREQSRGLFFEAMELEELRKAVKPGAHVVDVGANTGNHTIFFAGPMKAASVLPVEPLPAAADALRASVERNGLRNVNLSCLGVGVSDREGRAKLVFSGRGGLGATSLQSDSAGEIRVVRLDAIVPGHIDLLKIDVEGMEMSVLAGARDVIERTRPLIFVEIANENTLFLMSWLDSARYRVERIFSDKGHANYLLAPLR